MHVGIIGGGFAGRTAAVRVRLAGHDATLIDGRSAFVERTRLHEAVARRRVIVQPHAAFADRIGARFVRARVAALEGARVRTASGDALDFDRVVLAVGSVPDLATPGVAEHAVSLTGPTEAHRAADRLTALPEGSRVAVVGAGLTGLELATEVASAHPGLRVLLIGDPTRALSPTGVRAVQRALQALRIEVAAMHVREVTPSGLQTSAGPVPAAMTLWAAGMRPPPWLTDAGLPLDATGRVRVDATLRVPDVPEVVAAGDCAATALRMACATAMPLACHAVQTLVDEARGRDPRPMRFGYVMRCISLGSGRGLVQLTRRDDTPAPTAFTGRLGAGIKEAVLRVAAGLPGWEHATHQPWYRWPQGASAV